MLLIVVLWNSGTRMLLIVVLWNSGTDRQQARLAEIVKQFQALGVAEWLPDNVCRGRPVTVDDYQQCCVTLQSNRQRKFRHFLFLTGDLPTSLLCNLRLGCC